VTRTRRKAAGVTIGAAVVALALIPFAPVIAQAPASTRTPDRYTLGTVKADFKAGRRLGSKRAGLVCLPAGSFKWSDARAGLTDATTALATVLHDHAPAIVAASDDPFNDERAATRFKLVATIEDFTLNGCVKNWGLAAKVRHNHALSGRAHLSVAWDVFDRTTRAKADHVVVDTDFDLPPDTDDATDALLAGLKLNARQFAQQRWPGSSGH
jgi:hypothetical protein